MGRKPGNTILLRGGDNRLPPMALAALPFTYFSYGQRGNPKRKSDSVGFSYKEQYAVVVICKDEKEQEDIYNRLKAEGFKLKVVAV